MHTSDGIVRVPASATSIALEQGARMRVSTIMLWRWPIVSRFSRWLFSPWAPAKKNDDYGDLDPYRAEWRQRLGRYAYNRRCLLTLSLLAAIGYLSYSLASDVQVVIVESTTLSPTPIPPPLSPTPPPKTAATYAFARFLNERAPPAESLPLSCDELRNRLLHPYHLGAHVDSSLRAAQRAASSGEPDKLDHALRRATLIDDLHAYAERALQARPSMPCVCAPYFGELRRHLAVRNGTTHIIHMHNPTVRVPTHASVIEVESTEQDFLFPSMRAAAVRNKLARVSGLVLSYREADARCTLRTDALHVNGTLAHCVQDCLDLMMGKSVYSQ